MSVSNVTNSAVASSYATSTQSASNTSTAQTTQNEKKAAEEKANENTAAVYEKNSSSSSKTNSASIQRMIDEGNQKVNSMKELLKGLLNTQADKDAKSKGISRENALNSLYSGIASGKNVMVEVSDEVRAKAAEEVSEDGYYGVKQTSERILDFAKALVEASGNDPKMVEKMEKAVKEGFKQAADMWGKEKMPQITQDTYDAVMKGFSDWKESIGISTK